MTLEEAMRKIEANSDILMGEFKIIDDTILWKYSMSAFDSKSEEPHDRLWGAYCETTGAIGILLGEENVTLSEHWSDNDSCGFTINIKQP